MVKKKKNSLSQEELCRLRHDSKQLSQDEMVLDESRDHHLKFLTNQESNETEQSNISGKLLISTVCSRSTL